jgi:hypothetical protein
MVTSDKNVDQASGVRWSSVVVSRQASWMLSTSQTTIFVDQSNNSIKRNVVLLVGIVPVVTVNAQRDSTYHLAPGKEETVVG